MRSSTISRLKETLSSENPRALFAEKMRKKGMDQRTIETFTDYYRRVVDGKDGFLPEGSIGPVPEVLVADHEDLNGFEIYGRSILGRAARIVLNGGLGTSMGLTGPKSLVTVKNGKCFLDVILREARRENLPLCLMNSPSTHEETCGYAAGPEEFPPPLMFFQNMFPKILRDSLLPADWPADETMEWNPAGHGDVYSSLCTSGLLDKLLDQGIYYAFISNSDNLGASIDHSLLGYFSRAGFSLMMEVSPRTASDAKGGHLAMNGDGTLVLRESAQCRPEDRGAFQDIDRYRFFNTNNIWVNLVHLKKRIQRDGGIRLPMMLNPKHLDPRDPSSPGVYQIETAMGAAISLFKGAGVVCVSRSRFAPVKSTGDLLVLRSDRYFLSNDKGLVPAPGIENGRILVKLDPEYYGRLDRFEERFARGVPGLSGCTSLTIEGNVFFESGVTVRGDVTITSHGAAPRTVPAGTVIESDLILKGRDQL